MIALEAVGHVYARGTPWAHRALHGVDLAVAPGDALAVAGPNGAGKSTLAWILAGLTVPSEGRATLGGRPLHELRGQVLISFQHARLQLLRSTVAADVAFGTGAGFEDVRSALRTMDLDPNRFGPRRIDELSGGEQRRVVLAGLLVRHPRALVLDEPFAGLDAGGRRLLVQEIARLRGLGIAVVVVTQDLEGADRYAQRLVVLREGRVTADGPIEAVLATLDGWRGP